MTNTFVDVFAIEATSSAASRVEIATYFATVPKPGVQSVCGRSLSTVFGTPTQTTRVTELIADLGHLVSGVHGVVAAVVEEVADVVRLEHFDEALVFRAVLFEALELVARRAERARRRVSEPLDGGAGFLAAVDEVFGERADDAVTAGIHLVDELRLHRCLDDAGG